MPISTTDIPKSIVTHLEPAPLPKTSTILQTRTGKVQALGKEPSGIFKKELKGSVYVGPTGLVGDEHVYHLHGGIDRAIHQYPSQHYVDWRSEKPPCPDLFQPGGFGENLVATELSEENVCIGDVYRIGAEVVVQDSTDGPRGMELSGLEDRIHPSGRRDGACRAPSSEMVGYERQACVAGEECITVIDSRTSELEVLTNLYQDWAMKRLHMTIKTYELVESRNITRRVKHLTFRLVDPITIRQAEFEPFSFAQIEFGPQENKFKRSYSIVSGNLNTFSLGVALDDDSRGGSTYLHQSMKVGDRIRMSPGSSPKAMEDEERCEQEACITHRIAIIGGIGVTAFLPIMKTWEAERASYEVHYAVRSPEEAAYLDHLPKAKTTTYAKSQKERLRIEDVVQPAKDGKHNTKIYCCGPSSLMTTCQTRAEVLGFPDHMLHFESFGGQTLRGSRRGDPFEVKVHDTESGRLENLTVSADDSLLQTLRDAGFDMTYFCEAGGCGACKVTVRSGEVRYNGSGLKESEKAASGMLACVDRGLGRIEIELDEL